MIAFVACAALSACGAMNGRSESVKVTNKSVTQAQAPQGYGAAPSAAAAPYGAMASTPQVDVYNLDTGAPYGGGSDMMARGVSVSAFPGGAPLASDPSVTVFPIDGGGFGEFAPIAAAPLSPISPRVSRAPMPDVDSGMTPRAAVGGPVSSIYFDYGSAQIRDPYALRSVAETAKFAPVDRVVVEGHASPQTQTDDPVEARILNLRESLKRAEAVSKTLIREGVPAEKIKTVGWGDTKLSGGAEDAQRRVDIITAPGAGL